MPILLRASRVSHKKKKLIKPAPAPEEPPLVVEKDPKTPKQKRSPADKHEIFHLRRLVALESLWNDSKLATSLKIPLQRRVISVPARGDRMFKLPLEKLLRSETSKWVAHVNANPRNAMTFARANAIIEKIVTRKK